MDDKCVRCGKQTDLPGARLCNVCWELQHRIENNPDIAEAILNEVNAPKETRPSGEYWSPSEEEDAELQKRVSRAAYDAIGEMDCEEDEFGTLRRKFISAYAAAIGETRKITDELSKEHESVTVYWHPPLDVLVASTIAAINAGFKAGDYAPQTYLGIMWAAFAMTCHAMHHVDDAVMSLQHDEFPEDDCYFWRPSEVEDAVKNLYGEPDRSAK